jgi:hypothetical protein
MTTRTIIKVDSHDYTVEKDIFGTCTTTYIKYTLLTWNSCITKAYIGTFPTKYIVNNLRSNLS